MPDNDLCETPQATQQSVLNRSGKDKFILVLNLPHILRKQSTTDELLDLDPLQMSIYGAVVPPIQIPNTEVRYGGQSYNVSSLNRPNYPPLNVGFIIDNKLNDPRSSIYNGTPEKLKTWKDNLESGRLTEYQANFSVIGLNEYNQRTIEFVYYNAFITNLGGIDYDYTNPELIKTTAEFQYSQFDVKLL